MQSSKNKISPLIKTNKISPISNILTRAFYIAFGAILLLAAALCVFQGTRMQGIYPVEVKPLWLFVFALMWAVLLFAAFYALKRFEAFFTKHEKAVKICALFLFFALCFICARLMAMALLYDARYLFDGAASLAQTGNLGESEWYFYRYQNNAAPALYLAFWFKIGSFLRLAPIITGALVCSAGTALSVYFIYGICREVRGVRAAQMSMVLCFCTLPLYFFCAIPYTDTLSLPFAAGGIYFYIRAKNAAALEMKKARTLYMLAAGALIAVGASVKPTVYIAGVAIIIDVIMHCDIKRFILPILCAGVIIALFPIAENAYIYGGMLDRQQAESQHIPVMHWLMIGLSPDGAYTDADQEFTLKQPSPQARSEAISAEISRRIAEKSPADWLNWAKAKFLTLTGDGTYFVSTQLDDEVLYPNALHGIVLLQRPHYPLFYHVCTALYLICLVAAGAHCIIDKQSGLFVVRLALFGLLLFLMMWEVSARYMYNFAPLLLICGAVAISSAYEKPAAAAEKRMQKAAIK